MRSTYEVFEDDTSATILAQITTSIQGISASEIAKNTNIPQSTVYDHLRLLEKDALIRSKEKKIKNIVKKLWFRTDKPTFPDTERVNNLHYNSEFLSNINDLSSRIRFAQAFSRKNLVILNKISEIKFKKNQKSSQPAFMSQMFISKENYEFILSKIMEIEKELEKRDNETMKDTGSIKEKEKYQIFYFGMPSFD